MSLRRSVGHRFYKSIRLLVSISLAIGNQPIILIDIGSRLHLSSLNDNGENVLGAFTARVRTVFICNKALVIILYIVQKHIGTPLL